MTKDASPGSPNIDITGLKNSANIFKSPETDSISTAIYTGTKILDSSISVSIPFLKPRLIVSKVTISTSLHKRDYNTSVIY
jgi:hypothetical protein